MTLKDIISGFVTPVVIITSTLSYSALIFSGPLASSLPLGLGYGLISAGIMAIFTALMGGIPFAIAGPDSKPAAVLATVAAVAAASAAGSGQADVGETTLVALVAGTLVTGLVLYIFGAMKAGSWIRFIPFPVVGGFLAASGWLLAVGGIQVLIGEKLSLENLATLLEAPHLLQIAIGLAFAIALEMARRAPNSWAVAALLVAGTAFVHCALWIAGFSVADARAAGWLADLGSGAVLVDPWLSGTVLQSDPLISLKSSASYVALVAVTAATLLLSLLAIEVETNIEVDVDRELRVNGLANLLVGAMGGMVGTLSLSRTLFNYRGGTRTRASGVIAGVVCLLILGFGTPLLGYMPVPILGALLLQLGATMLYDWLIKGWREMQRSDYAQVVVILLVIAFRDFVAGVAVGIVAACITFAVNTSRIRLVRLGLNRSNFSSRVDRPAYHQEALLHHGDAIQIMWLHGFVFFGTANRLLLQIRELVTGLGHGVCRHLILDFRQVLGIDTSAVLSLSKLRQIATREGLTLALTDLPPAVDRLLRAGGFIGRQGDDIVKVFPGLDAALEWCEDQVLLERITREEAVRSADEWLARELGGADFFTRMVSYLEMVEYEPGDYIFQQGEAGNSLSLLYTGRVTILFATPEGTELRLRSMLGHTVVGEMGLYRAAPRGASVRVDRPTIVYRLSLEALSQMEEEEPALAHAFHKFVIRTVAARLDFANREIAALQR